MTPTDDAGGDAGSADDDAAGEDVPVRYARHLYHSLHHHYYFLVDGDD